MTKSTEKTSKEERRRDQALARINELRRSIAALDWLCSGTLSHRTKTCGQPTCHCHTDPTARHGPYFEWTRLERGRLVHRSIAPDQADLLRKAIANFRAIRALLRRWERETLRALGVRPTEKR